MNIQKEAVIDRVMTAFGLQYTMQTDPQLMKEILEEMQLSEFKTSHPSVRVFFEKIVHTSQDLQPMFMCIKKAILEKHPAIIEFAELGLEKKWFAPSPCIVRTVHRIFVLEALTSAMCNSHTFFIEIQDHYKQQERLCGFDTRHPFQTALHTLKTFHSVFKMAKLLSVDSAMIYLRTQRGSPELPFSEAELKKMLRDKKINYIEYKLLSAPHPYGLEHVLEALRLNIYEAGVSEYRQGLQDNARCADALAEDILKNPPHITFDRRRVIPEHATDNYYQSIQEASNLFPTISVSQNWTSLYVTWNMAFVLNTVDNPDILFSKLLIPSLLDCKPENFLGVRAISLWLAINNYIFRECKRKGHVEKVSNGNLKANCWAGINKKYAMILLQKEIGENATTFQEKSTQFFLHPLWNTLKLIQRLQ